MRTTVSIVLSLLVIALSATRAQPADGEKKPAVRADVVAVVENELTRLSNQADKEAGPNHPRPSSEVAFMLLTGLAAQGSPVRQPTAEDLRQLGVEIESFKRGGVQLFTIAG